MPETKTPAKENPVNDANLALDKYRILSNNITAIIMSFFKFGTFVLIAYFVYLSIKCLSGEKTMADIAIKLLGDFKISEYVAYAITGGAVISTYKFKKLSKNKITKAAERIKSLEQKLLSQKQLQPIPVLSDKKENSK